MDFRRKKPTPYMEGLRVQQQRSAPDPDSRVLSDEQLEQAKASASR